MGLKKIIFSAVAVLLTGALLYGVSATDFSFADVQSLFEKEEETSVRAGVTGTFTSSVTVQENTKTAEDADTALRVYGDKGKATDGNMYVTAYPLNTVDGAKIQYKYEQRLKLKKDFSYSYQYTITLTNGEEWGKDFATMSVQMNGTFTYEESDSSEYTVTLGNPVAGTQTISGITVTGEGNIFAWTANNAPTYTLNIESELSADENYRFDRYLAGRTVKVDKTEKSVEDDLFYADILDDIAPYSDYTF
jgi:hypothetical protein